MYIQALGSQAGMETPAHRNVTGCSMTVPQCYRPAVFFRHFCLTALSVLLRKIQRMFQQLFPFVFFKIA
jgi:hypothetical protein